MRSLAKIVPTTSVPSFVPPTRCDSLFPKKKEAIRLSDLPSHLQRGFENTFSVRLRELFGYTTPWEQPEDEAIMKIWLEAFPETMLDDDAWLKAVVYKLVSFNFLHL